ncbi:HAD family hydrolase [Crateriforma conspicua]|uniref:HAD family hydrolase n=1 Tax=Crateriforma conspicua TaxID=2527996 RepID=UPI001188969B|nr:HAD family hydrolase [Crateriforma conspicua]QDV64410.1 Phosphonoacetaldehyde hydrolase [Crateriforma conspicua]
MSGPKISMIVFDVAGTTVSDKENAVARCVSEAVTAAGVPTDAQAVNPLMGTPKPDAIRTLLARDPSLKITDALVNETHQDFQNRMIDYYRHSPGVVPTDGAVEVFQTLRDRGIKVALDTGFDRPTLDTILDRLSWHDQVDATVSSDQAAGRPDPGMIHHLMRQLGESDPRRVAKVGDSVSDVRQGLAADCGWVAAVLSERTRPLFEEPVDPDYRTVHTIESLQEILPHFDPSSPCANA